MNEELTDKYVYLKKYQVVKNGIFDNFSDVNKKAKEISDEHKEDVVVLKIVNINRFQPITTADRLELIEREVFDKIKPGNMFDAQLLVRKIYDILMR